MTDADMPDEEMVPFPCASTQRNAAPVDQERCEDAYALHPGAAVSAADDGRTWVFIGWRQNSAGRNAWFARTVEGWEKGDPSFYSAAFAPTLAKRFPDVEKYRRSTSES